MNRSDMPNKHSRETGLYPYTEPQGIDLERAKELIGGSVYE